MPNNYETFKWKKKIQSSFTNLHFFMLFLKSNTKGDISKNVQAAFLHTWNVEFIIASLKILKKYNYNSAYDLFALL